jgi:hypothetical protein
MEALIGQALRKAPWSEPVQKFEAIIFAVTTSQIGQTLGLDRTRRRRITRAPLFDRH